MQRLYQLKLNKNKSVFCYSYLFIIPTIWNLRILTDFPQHCIMKFFSTVVYRVIIFNYVLSFSSFVFVLYSFDMCINTIGLEGPSSLCTHSPSSLPPFLPSWHLGVPERNRWDYGSTNVSLEPEGENPHSDPHRQSPLRKALHTRHIKSKTYLYPLTFHLF